VSKQILSLLFFVALITQNGRADNMTTLLKSCAYGTLAGAAVGLASLAITENPGGKINNVARGASLGLYAGIGIGIYLVNNPEKANMDYGQLKKSEEIQTQALWFSPITNQNKIEGAQLNWARITF